MIDGTAARTSMTKPSDVEARREAKKAMNSAVPIATGNGDDHGDH